MLGPVLAAFARIADRGLAMARPLLLVEKRGWHAEILAWPADAPPVGWASDQKGRAFCDT